jgi:hypothetical protein
MTTPDPHKALSADRIKAYLDRREKAQGLEVEHIHTFDGGGDDPGFQLLHSDIRTLLAERDAAVRDAECYRLLRRGQHWSVINGIGYELRADQLDAAIDATMKGQP